MTNHPAGAGRLRLDLDLVLDVELPRSLDLAALRCLVGFVLGQEGASGRWTVDVVLTGDERLRALHRDFMRLDTPTDVMTFPLGDDDPGSARAQGGDIVISVERATAQAGEFHQTPDDEVRFLVVHGLLHLCGWDDATEAARVAMLDRQSELIQAFDRRPSRTGDG